jgi:hypothetical protein
MNPEELDEIMNVIFNCLDMIKEVRDGKTGNTIKIDMPRPLYNEAIKACLLADGSYNGSWHVPDLRLGCVWQGKVLYDFTHPMALEMLERGENLPIMGFTISRLGACPIQPEDNMFFGETQFVPAD